MSKLLAAQRALSALNVVPGVKTWVAVSHVESRAASFDTSPATMGVSRALEDGGREVARRLLESGIERCRVSAVGHAFIARRVDDLAIVIVADEAANDAAIVRKLDVLAQSLASIDEETPRRAAADFAALRDAYLSVAGAVGEPELSRELDQLRLAGRALDRVALSEVAHSLVESVAADAQRALRHKLNEILRGWGTSPIATPVPPPPPTPPLRRHSSTSFAAVTLPMTPAPAPTSTPLPRPR